MVQEINKIQLIQITPELLPPPKEKVKKLSPQVRELVLAALNKQEEAPKIEKKVETKEAEAKKEGGWLSTVHWIATSWIGQRADDYVFGIKEAVKNAIKNFDTAQLTETCKKEMSSVTRDPNLAAFADVASSKITAFLWPANKELITNWFVGMSDILQFIDDHTNFIGNIVRLNILSAIGNLAKKYSPANPLIAELVKNQGIELKHAIFEKEAGYLIQTKLPPNEKREALGNCLLSIADEFYKSYCPECVIEEIAADKTIKIKIDSSKLNASDPRKSVVDHIEQHIIKDLYDPESALSKKLSLITDQGTFRESGLGSLRGSFSRASLSPSPIRYRQWHRPKDYRPIKHRLRKDRPKSFRRKKNHQRRCQGDDKRNP